MEKHEMSTVFFTNAFDASHIIPNHGMGEFIEMKPVKSMISWKSKALTTPLLNDRVKEWYENAKLDHR